VRSFIGARTSLSNEAQNLHFKPRFFLSRLATGVSFMAIENRFTQEDRQPAAPVPSDAYEAYWSSTEDDAYGQGKARPLSTSDSQFCKPGDAYNELWQLWDAHW
jgi:hypothetical protein